MRATRHQVRPARAQHHPRRRWRIDPQRGALQGRGTLARLKSTSVNQDPKLGSYLASRPVGSGSESAPRSDGSKESALRNAPKVQTLQTLRIPRSLHDIDPTRDRSLDRPCRCQVLIPDSRWDIVRSMNYSDAELLVRPGEGILVETGVQLLPVIAKALYLAISGLGDAHGLTPAQVKVLLQLGTRRQMTVGEIATALDCSMPAASELVDRLVDAGHLVRASDPADRRRVLIAATPASQQISAHLCELREAQVRYALDQLEPEERPTFIKSLQALIAGLAHAKGTSSLADGPGAPVASVDHSPANAVSLADPTTAPQVREGRVTKEPIRSASLRGSN